MIDRPCPLLQSNNPPSYCASRRLLILRQVGGPFAKHEVGSTFVTHLGGPNDACGLQTSPSQRPRLPRGGTNHSNLHPMQSCDGQGPDGGGQPLDLGRPSSGYTPRAKRKPSPLPSPIDATSSLQKGATTRIIRPRLASCFCGGRSGSTHHRRRHCPTLWPGTRSLLRVGGAFWSLSNCHPLYTLANIYSSDYPDDVPTLHKLGGRPWVFRSPPRPPFCPPVPSLSPLEGH